MIINEIINSNSSRRIRDKLFRMFNDIPEVSNVSLKRRKKDIIPVQYNFNRNLNNCEIKLNFKLLDNVDSDDEFDEDHFLMIENQGYSDVSTADKLYNILKFKNLQR